jgi:hypothetical protein
MKLSQYSQRFVEFVPDVLEDGVLYVSMSYAVVSHRCACGCGREVVTPLSPTDWKLMFDGETVSLDPSIGNWSFPCRSHYFIRRGRVQWAGNMADEQIQRGRLRDRATKQAHFASRATAQGEATPQDGAPSSTVPPASRHDMKETAWTRLKKFVNRSL